MFLRNSQSFFCLLGCVMTMIFLMFYEPVLEPRLVNSPDNPKDPGFGLTPGQAAYIIALPCFTYAVACIFVSYLTRYISRRMLVYYSFNLNVIALILFGPSQLFPFDSLIMLCCGLGLLGVSVAFILVPLLPEMLQVI